jgi:hypothetical protein
VSGAREALRRLAVPVVVLGMVALGLGVAPGRSPAQPQKKAEAPTVVPPGAPPHRVVAYYFRYDFRCARCMAFEAYSREALESAFARQLADGRLVFKVVNVEVKGNEHFRDDYQLYTKSLILVDEARGRKPRWKNLEKIWQLVGNKEAFLRYVQDETRAYLDRRS